MESWLWELEEPHAGEFGLRFRLCPETIDPAQVPVGIEDMNLFAAGWCCADRWAVIGGLRAGGREEFAETWADALEPHRLDLAVAAYGLPWEETYFQGLPVNVLANEACTTLGVDGLLALRRQVGGNIEVVTPLLAMVGNYCRHSLADRYFPEAAGRMAG